MTTNHEHDGEDEIQAARRTAHALGQTEGAEQVEVAAEMAASPQVYQEVEAVEALAARLKKAAGEAPQPEPSPALREAIERRLAEIEPAAGRAATQVPARPWWQSRMMALALTAACLVALAVPIVWSTNLLGLREPQNLARQSPREVMDAPDKTLQEGLNVVVRGTPKTSANASLSLLEQLNRKDDIGEIEDSPPAEMDVDPTLARPGKAAQEAEYNDESKEFNQKGGGSAAAGRPEARGRLGAMAFGPSPKLAGSPGIGMGLGTGSASGTNGDSTRAGDGHVVYDDPVGLREDAVRHRHVVVDDRAGGRHDYDGRDVVVRHRDVMDDDEAVVHHHGHHGGGGSGGGGYGGGGGGDSSGPADHSARTDHGRPRLGLSGSMHDALANAVDDARGTTGLTKSGSGTVVVSGANNYSGGTTVNAGKLETNVGLGDGSDDTMKARGSYPVNVERELNAELKRAEDEYATGKDASGKELTAEERKVAAEQIGAMKQEAAAHHVHGENPDEVARGISNKVVYPDAQKSSRPPQKPLETWKPAHVVPNSSRLMVGEREELPLKGMQVDVRVDGFRARVLIDLYYFNDRPQQLEGNFQLRLPDEASPYFFAFGRTVYQAPQVTTADSMFFKPQQVSQGDTTPEKILALRGASWEQPKVARMVPREKAALAYRDMVRRRIDPALVEWSGAGVFQCRVFPLAPHSLHRVTIGYDVDLLRVGDDLELRLDLPGQTPATIVDLNIAASDARQVSLDAPATTSADGQRLSYRLIDPKDSPLAVRLRKPGTQMLTGNDEATGSYFATRVGLTLPETPSVDRAKQAIFLVDTSLSAGPQFPLWTKLLRATLENNRDSIREFAVVFFNVETFWWQEKFVANTPENVDALLDYSDGLALEGATDLGRALKEAASPGWLKKANGPSPDLFLLSDGAATWGEDRWALLANALTPGPSPATGEGSKTPGPSSKGRGESALFAYRTGLAGGDPRLLAYLAEQTGGAVFSLVGEAEIASASVAHRNRPWRLTGVEMAGGHDLLVAGRPQYVFPGQQLLVVGRLETVGNALRGVPEGRNATEGVPYSRDTTLTFTLQQGKATQTITVKPNHFLTSELAARTFGQVATSQLEDVSSAAASAEPVATAYARHFRVTGRTCSLLMLESEQDYARFNIKPEEDSFVVKDRPADPIVAKTVAEVTAAMGDPKANFLAWYRRVRASSEVHFDLPASLDVALDGLPAETFAVTAPPLQCKLRLRKDLPENLRQPWQSGLPDYETLAAEAERRLAAYSADDALRGLSSLVEDRPGDAALARDLAFSAIDWQRPGEAYHLLRRAGAARTFEPITFHAMAHCLELMGRADLAIIYYELACGGQWDGRFGDIHNIAHLDYLRFLRRVTDGRLKATLADYAKARMATLAGMQLRDTADVAALICWNTDGTDVDLHVIEPSGEECFYQHTQTASGGHISRDVTTGYGPELYLLPNAPAGNYRISAHYFATDANRASTRTKVFALIYEGWGTKDEKVTVKALALTGRSENHELATVKR